MRTHDRPLRFFPAGRADLAQSAVVFFSTLAALAVLGTVLAYWTWSWLAPRPVPRAQPVAETGGAASAQSLFGKASTGRATAAPGAPLRLLGVAADSTGRRGYAVMQLEARRIIAVREGEEVAPGIRLEEVHPDHVVVARNGGRETLAWPEARPSATPAARLTKK